MDNEENKKIVTRKLSPIELERLFKSNEFSDIIGVEETEQIDFKKHFYSLGTDQQKYELAKDIAAIANSGGGLICFGFSNGECLDRPVSYAKTLSPIKNNDFDLRKFTQILRNKLIPQPPTDLINHEFFGGPGQFYLAIKVKPTPKEMMPFLIPWKNSQTDYFLCPHRYGSDTTNLIHINKIHEYISAGYTKALPGSPRSINDEINEKLNLILSKLSLQPTDNQKNDSIKDKYVQYTKNKINPESGFFYIVATPIDHNSFAEFWDKDKNGIYNLLLDPPRIRDNGWDFQTAIKYGETPYPIDNRWESMNGSEKITLIDKNGTIFAAGALNGFLDWGVDDYKSNDKFEGKLINNFAFVEYIDCFARFLLKLNEEHLFFSSYKITFGFSLPSEIKIGLLRPPHLGHYREIIVGPNTSLENEFVFESSSNKEPKYLAGEIIKTIYASIFSLTDSYAYLGEDEKGTFVKEERFK